MVIRYNVDEEFFAHIDTPKKAYVLGFIWGDGSIDKKHSMLRIEISSKDEMILNKIKLSMNSNHRIYRRTRVRNSTTTLSSTLVIGRKSVVNDLVKLGLSANKNSSLKLPDLHNELYFDFIRGLYDSDGHINIDNKNRVTCSLISTTELCNSINKIFSANGIFAKVINTNYDFLSRLVIYKKSDVLTLRSRLYKDASVYLRRKKEIFDNVHYKDTPDFSGNKNPFFGRAHSEKTKRALREANIGEKCGSSKLKKNDVVFIKSNPHIKTKELSEMFNISPGTVRSIMRGDTWSHVRIKEVNHG